MNDKLLHRIPDVVEFLNISRSKVYELLKSGQLPSVRIDRTRLVRHEDLVAYVESLPLARLDVCDGRLPEASVGPALRWRDRSGVPT